MSDPFDLNRYAVGGAAEPVGAWSAASDQTEGPMVVGSPPVGWLAGALVVALLGAAGAIFVVRPGPATVVPWVLAGPVAIVLLGVYSIVDTRRRAMPIYASAGWVRPLYVVAIVVILAAVTVTAVGIAFWVGRL